MKKYVLIRDDDTNFFTSPNMLEELYSEIFEMKIPINLSLIPCINTNIETTYFSDEKKKRRELFIPEKIDQEITYIPITYNLDLVEYLRGLKGSFEPIQHGYSHSMNEFSTFNFYSIIKKLDNGKKILKKLLYFSPNYFSAPYDVYSPMSMFLVKKYFHGATYGLFRYKQPLIKYFPITMISKYIQSIKNNDVFFFDDNFLLLGYNKNAIIRPFIDYDDVKKYFNNFLLSENKVAVLVQHYWAYFYSMDEDIVSTKLNKEAYELFIEVIQYLKSYNDIEFLTIAEFYKRLRARACDISIIKHNKQD